MWKWATIAGLIGYLILHPAVMISGHLMMESSASLSLEHVVAHEIKRSFSLEMLPWSLAFALCAAAFGGLYGRLKGLEQVLRASRVRYQTVVDDQLDYICRIQPGGKCTFVNNSLCHLIYRTRESLLNQSLFELTEFEDPTEWRARIEKLSPENPKTQIEQRLKLPDGTTCWIRWIVIAIVDDAGEIAEYQCVGHDITDIKRAQKLLESSQEELEYRVQRRTLALNQANESLEQEIQERIALEKNIRESELKYRTLFESAPMGIALTTFQGKILAANKALLNMLQLQADELDRISAKSIYAFAEDRDRLLFQLKGDHLIQEAEVQLKRQDGTLFYASLNLTRFFLEGEDTILAVVNDISIRKKALEKLRTSETNLHQLSSQLITIQEEERQRIARELHDSVGQLMHALKYSIETSHKQLDVDCSRTEMQSRLAQLMPVVQEATAEIRRIVMDLRPSMLDDLGILATVNWFCREYRGIYKNITVDKEIHIEESDIPFELRVVFFRIIQEAFNNVSKHSQASRIRLTIARQAHDLVVEITDNGIGLNGPDSQHDPQNSKGLGLSSMRERARASGGHFQLKSSSDDGTRIRVVWPAQGPAREATQIQSGKDREV